MSQDRARGAGFVGRRCRSIGCFSFLYLFFPVITFTLSFSPRPPLASRARAAFPGERRPDEDDDDDER